MRRNLVSSAKKSNGTSFFFLESHDPQQFFFGLKQSKQTISLEVNEIIYINMK